MRIATKPARSGGGKKWPPRASCSSASSAAIFTSEVRIVVPALYYKSSKSSQRAQAFWWCRPSACGGLPGPCSVGQPILAAAAFQAALSRPHTALQRWFPASGHFRPELRRLLQLVQGVINRDQILPRLVQGVINRDQILPRVLQPFCRRTALLHHNLIPREAFAFRIPIALLSKQYAAQLDPRDADVEMSGRQRRRIGPHHVAQNPLRFRRLPLIRIDAGQTG